MIIYKITNLINNKVYIGKTIKTIEWRFKKHWYDASKNPNTRNHLHRAMLLHGKENFKIEQIDNAETSEELNQKEQYWISYYKSQQSGYNMTSGGEGGNTYKSLTAEELNEVKLKISSKNFGKQNGQSKQVKFKSIKTNEELFFDTITECLNYFKIKNKDFILIRATGKCNLLWRDEWQIAYQDEEYHQYEQYDPSTRKGQKLKLVKGTEEIIFNSKNKAIEFLKATKPTFEKKAAELNYQIIYF